MSRKGNRTRDLKFKVDRIVNRSLEKTLPPRKQARGRPMWQMLMDEATGAPKRRNSWW